MDFSLYLLSQASWTSHYTPRKHRLLIIPPANIVWGVYRNRSVCLSVRLSGITSTSFVRFPPNFVKFKIMMCELCRNFETIQYSLCHHKFSYMINQKFMKLCTLQDPDMKMCTLVGYPGPLNFTPVMLLWT